MKRAALFTLILVTFQLVFSQELKDHHSVMIIPFNPNMYFSDSDDALAKHNDKSIKEVRTMFRYGLNINLNAKILSQYDTRPLLTDTAKGAVEDLYNIYRSISYFQSKNMPNIHLKDEGDAQNKQIVKRNKGVSAEEDAQTTSSLKLLDQTKNYINVRLHKPEILAFLKVGDTQTETLWGHIQTHTHTERYTHTES